MRVDSLRRLHAARGSRGDKRHSGGGQVTLPANLYLLSNGPILITTPDGISINGHAASDTIIDGQNINRVFELSNSGLATIQNVTAQHGQGTTVGSVSGHGHGGCIHNHGQLTLTDSVVKFCRAAANWNGGAITNATAGTLALTNDTISNGVTDSTDRGGGLENLHNATLTNVTISGNSAGAAGGVLNLATLKMTGSVVAGNIATTGVGNDGAGGILNGPGTAATATISGSTISGNQAQVNGGGGLQNDGTAAPTGPTVTIVNSTIANNTAAGFGGGIDNFDLDASPPSKPVTTLQSSTVVGNHAGASGGGLQQFRSIYNVGNSLLAGNSAATSAPDCANALPDTIGSQGYNLIGNTSGCGGFGSTGDLMNVNPLVGPLAPNGGPTPTIALLAGSPAINAGNPATPGSGGTSCPSVDQRGLPRGGAAGRCDVGAFEVQPPPPPPALGGLAISPHTFSVGGRLVGGHCVKQTKENKSHKHCKRPISLRVTFTLSSAANVTFSVKREAPGRKSGGKCVKPTKKNAKHKKCVRIVSVDGAITKAEPAGADTFVFDGKVGGKRLAPGSYDLVATPSAAGGSGPQRTVKFKLTP